MSGNIIGVNTIHCATIQSQHRIYFSEKKAKPYQYFQSTQCAERIYMIEMRWYNLNVRRHGTGGDYDLADDILICLIKIGLSQIEIKSILSTDIHCAS